MMKELDECFFMVLLLHRLQLLWLNARPEWLLKILKRPDESDLAPCMRQLGRCWQSKLSNQKTVASKDSVKLNIDLSLCMAHSH
ncbi:hypothetical protein QQP08_011540 [Theobroma cacao]|nr:hypothetical protein QQP08_011540 [Theobroma cacao]